MSISLFTATAAAQITESDWDASLTGAQDWQVDSNWSTATFPDDPGREDLDMTTFDPVIGANLSVGLGAALDLNVGATDVTVASLRMGGTAGPVSTTVSSTGGRLAFENFELNDATDPENVIPAWNASRALIVSGGPPASTNQISAPVHVNDTLDVGTSVSELGTFSTTNDITFSGEMTFGGTGSSLNALSSKSIYVTGPVVTEVDPDGETPEDTTSARFNASGDAQGTIHITGVVSGPGTLRVGGAGGTTILSAANTVSNFSYGRGTLVLDHDQAMGTDTRIREGGLGAPIVSTDDERTVSVTMDLSGYPLVAGDHSLTWVGDITQSNSRGWVNLIAPGKTFNIAGKIAADDDPPEVIQNEREFYFDGTGEWVISGEMVNRLDSEEYPLPENDQPQSFGHRGTGTVRVTGTNNTYSAYTRLEGGNWRYASNETFPQAEIQSISGTVGVDTGTLYVGGNPNEVNSEFLAMLQNRDQAGPTSQGDVESFMDYDSGGVMLSPLESSADFDFTSGELASVADMSLSGPAEGIEYTGAVTPANSTYRFGGGTGVITLPGANQLTGANDLVVSNGLDSGDVSGLGGVRITGVNDYTGETRIQGQYLQSLTQSAGGEGIAGNSYNGTTLTVTQLADGGVSSSIGASSSDASNLLIQGSTLRYEGDGDSTDRLFTVGTHGATLDASGSGPVAFTNTGALNIASANDRPGVISGFAFSHKTGVTQSSEWVAYGFPDTSDLVRGMQVSEDGGTLQESSADDDETITLTGIQSQTRIVLSDQQNLFSNINGTPSTWSFIDVERTFTLTGDNTGDNVLAPTIGDSATNVLNLAKEGEGKWILTGDNTYTGDTLVREGTLSITNAYLADDAEVRIDSGAVFDLDFVGVDTVGSLFLGGASVAAGTYGAFGTGADFEHAMFSGTGILAVSQQMATNVPGDYNNDGVVDAADYTVFRDNLGADEGVLMNDLIGGAVGAAHYEQWVDNYGRTEPLAVVEGSAAVPEAQAVTLCLLALGSLAWIRGVGRRAAVCFG